MFKAMFVIVPVLTILIFIFTFVLMFSSKARGKMMSKQIKAAKYMMDESKDDIEEISTGMADATKRGVETTTRAIKKGLTGSESQAFCKECGYPIDRDSNFCKKCGKMQ